MTAFKSFRWGGLASLALLLAFATIWLPTRGMAQWSAGAAAPPGSYLNSCMNISYNQGRITAWCDIGKGQHKGLPPFGQDETYYNKYASIVTKNCSKSADISNYYGDLVCTSILPTDVAPGGSYLQSCANPHVLDGELIVRCDDHVNLKLQLGQCDVSKPVANIQGQLICAPKPAKAPAAKPVAQAGPAAWTPTPTQAKLKAVGCTLFLGRANEFLCKDDAGFAQCKAMINGGDVKTCHAPGQLTTDCQHFLGRADEYLCLSEPAYQQCLSFQAQGKAKACHANGH